MFETWPVSHSARGSLARNPWGGIVVASFALVSVCPAEEAPVTEELTVPEAIEDRVTFSDRWQQRTNRDESPDGEVNRDVEGTGAGSPDAEAEPSRLDEIWELPVLISDDTRPFLQEFRFYGRYHTQGYVVDSGQGSADGWETRRARLGGRAVFLDHFVLGALFNLKTDEGDSVIDKENIDTLTLAWDPNEDFHLVIGQQKPGFTYEYATSSNRILTFERSLLVNQLAPDKSPGITIEGKRNGIHYEAGAFSGVALGEDFDNFMGIAKLGYDFSEWTRLEKSSTHLHYLYNSDVESENAAPYRHAFAAGFDLQNGAYSSLIQLILASGYDDTPDAWGFTVMPAWYLIEDKLQVVARYQFANSPDADGLSLQSRYERKVPDLTGDGNGERYHAGYLGLNWYLHGNKLKFMAGAEYSHMRGGGDGGDYSGWTWMTGLRLYF